MCSGSWNSKKHSSSPVFIRQQHKQQQKKKKPHVSMTLRRKRLRLRRREEPKRAGAELEMLNLKLFLENRCILAENERLRERASVLSRENLALRANLCKTGVAMLPAAAGAEDAHGC